jgi:hypothetical protein
MVSDHPIAWILLVVFLVLLGRWHERAGSVTPRRVTRGRVR